MLPLQMLHMGYLIHFYYQDGFQHVDVYLIVTNPEKKTNLTSSAITLLPSSERGYHDDIVVAWPSRQLVGLLGPRPRPWSLGG